MLGGIYFGGLWWTVLRMPRARRPFRLYFVSLLVRTVAVAIAFYGVLTLYRWPSLIAALLGFVIARLMLLRFLGQLPATESSAGEAV